MSNFWEKNQKAKISKEAYEKQTIRKIQNIIDQGYDIEELLKTNNIIKKSIIDNKIYCLKYFLKILSTEKKIEEAHIYIKENNLKKIEKIFTIYSSNKKLKRKNIFYKYRNFLNKKKYSYL
tara:strand:+ start:100173 stop:100535 length:363 start_codon:yes stop_codon:yes gene_type:complete